MDNKIKIDIVSDVVCPWCVVGYRKLKQAITELEIEDKIEIEWQPFQLNPDMPKEGKNENQYSIDKYKLNKNDLIKRRNTFVEKGEEVGFKFDLFEDMKIFNTLDAHILLEYAREFGKQTQLEVRLTEAFFSERKDISNRDTLSLELQSVGLNAKEGLSKLDDQKVRKYTETKASNWVTKGVTGVPTMVFNDEITLNGALPIGTYKQVLTEILGLKKFK